MATQLDLFYKILAAVKEATAQFDAANGEWYMLQGEARTEMFAARRACAELASQEAKSKL